MAFAQAAGRNRMRLEDRKVSELVGICRGVLADGAICGAEAAFLLDWIARTEAFATEYPYDALLRRLADAMLDGVLDLDEERDLLATLSAFVGGEAFDATSHAASLSSTLPLCDPAPAVVHDGRRFVVTGTFVSGSRSEVVAQIAGRGGAVQPNVTLSTDYLVIGSVASRDWIQSSYGRKIEKAVGYRSDGVPIAIVSEDHWRHYL